ncbi:2-phospho-L-lactate guanylyltransferase [Actinotalea sp.]|uniref:2-phospho-L-lactate guanylyltransferase n=1 Tax=Actinotalea sp. TaxID=1872145 RepID=UPI002CE32F1D|nr:2-phospho-L-lactate guanylyltransferase [Actinotalea sp.]HQY32578.1 2-phospho-L-lactate guanylyltransferase [Actinotalea sp.]HRA49945.1 2-phospho-L-lactate guanylyltransferase [Actinotalea sp.]
MTGWTVVVPVKRLADAKTRLDLAATDPARADLALALALDTVHAALAAREVDLVVVVTGEPRVAEALGARPGVRLLADPGGGLNAALAAGVAAALTAARADAAPGPIALLLGDLPALVGPDLDAALVLAAGHARAVVPDADGTGTTLLTALTGEMVPRFGPGSFAAHVAAGHTALPDVPPGLRRDVDTAADLRAAARLGVGRATAALLRREPVYCRLDRR